MQSYFKKINNIEETAVLAADLLKIIDEPFVLAIDGNLGAGKTTFCSAFLQAKNVRDHVKSPSFALLNIYDDQYFHFDLYRLKNEDEFIKLGFHDLVFDRNNSVILEWASLLPQQIPAQAWRIFIDYDKHFTEILSPDKFDLSHSFEQRLFYIYSPFPDKENDLLNLGFRRISWPQERIDELL